MRVTPRLPWEGKAERPQYYKLLGFHTAVDRCASPSVIKKAYTSLKDKYEPHYLVHTRGMDPSIVRPYARNELAKVEEAFLVFIITIYGRITLSILLPSRSRNFEQHVLGLCDQGKPESDFQNPDLMEQCRELAPDLSDATLRSLFDKLDTNMFQHGLFVECAFCNHSCTPNLAKRFSKDKRVLSLEAISDIALGEDCFITYFNKKELEEPVFSRRARTESCWGFTCACQRCVAEGGQG